MEIPFAHIAEHNKSAVMKMSSLSNFSNSTIADESWKDDVKPILDYLLLAILIVVMLAMGCEVTWASIWKHFKQPMGLLIGLICQFLFKPLCAFAFLKLTGITGLYATGVLIIACCPGGVLSNTFTYFCDGDIGLSVAMTSVSTVFAMGTMPGNLWLYGRSFESDNLVIPYKEMALSLISVTSPVMVGMILKYKVPSLAKWAAKIGSYCGIGIMIVCIAIELIVFPTMFDDVPYVLYGLSVALPIVGLGLGYFCSFLGRQNSVIRKTVALECGIQNVPVALTIIAMSFPLEMQEDIVLLPWLYGFVMVTSSTILCIIYNCLKKRNERLAAIKDGVSKDENDEEKEDLMEKNLKLALQSVRTSLTNGMHMKGGDLNEKEDLMENGVKIVLGSFKSSVMNGKKKSSIGV